MPSPPDFRLYHSNALDVLAGLLAEAVREPAPGQSLLAPDVVLIPQVAMKRWLQATLAQTHGIAANLEFLTPGEFVRAALDHNSDPAERDGDLDNAALRWRLYAALTDPALMARPAMASLRGYLADADPLKPDLLKHWALAVELASVFEKYQAWRRDMLLGWEQQPQLSRLDPQAELWRHIAGGQAHRARRIDNYLARFGAHDGPLPQGLPTRLFAFATLNVSPDVLRVIATQARVGPLHFYMPTPVGLWWGDLRTASERWRDVLAGSAMEATDENPLLQAWGMAGRDFVAMLGDYETVHPSFEIAVHARPEHDDADRPPAGRLLGWLQHDLFHRNARPSGTPRAQLDRDDRSLQVHACHTRLREVQVLHDQLRDLLERDPTLQPRDIAVLAPDIDPYIPHIEAVFGGRAGQTDFIPYALADASPLAGEPLAEVFLRLLDLPLARFGLNETLDLLASPPLARAAGLDANALDRLHGWLHAAGARWGLHARHRAAHAAPPDDAFTWQFALDRLLLGHASGSDADIAGIAPWSELEGGALDALDVLLRLLRVLAREQEHLGAAMTPARWRERLIALLAELVPEASADAAGLRALERLRRLIDDFASSAKQADVDQDVPPEAVRAHFAAELGAADTRAPLLTGGISFGRMVPMRLLPFRVIAVLGLNDGDYPRRDPAAGLNKLTADLGTARRRPGDRSLREDDRFLFLQLFAAASDVFYLSYLGADPRDGSVREPSVLVSELLDVAASHHADSQTVRRQLVVHHPLQPFSPQAFGAAGEGASGDIEARRFSYRSEWHPAADLERGIRRAEPAFATGVLPAGPADTGEAVATLSIEALRRFLLDPSGEFLKQSLSLRLPETVESEDDTEPLVVAAGLPRHALQQELLDACISSAGDSRDADWRKAQYAQLMARGMLPAGPLGRAAFETMLAEVRPYAEAFNAWRGTSESTSLAVDIDLGDMRLQGRVEGLYPAGLGRVRIGQLKGPEVIRHGLDWLAVCAADHPVSLTRFFETADKRLATMVYPAVSTEDARNALRQLLELRTEGLREPLPFAPRSGWAWYDEDRPERALEKAEQAWNGSNGGWGESHEAAVRTALRGRDPFAEGADDLSRLARFQAISRSVFQTLIDGRPHGFNDDGARDGATRS